ncbi:lipopolysaccharide assembly protein LapB [Candidatus Albibeggiatoa sp. nov. NOAA]|uniref:lipopolysaccharide assembly protein LapB n=1 Tax=Candidatus Albibeggiatoa sp. nov. NOAA TaxID=3162724 RepID=UPI0032FBBE9E|nr:lipopolysaccharide assembly protein LapB [Thiotrichaceae bacterium]
MIDFLWLLLPVAAASGWFAAQRSSRLKSTSSTFNLSSDYFKGLNYLLNEQPDKAIDIFVKLIDVDSDTVETHLALGALFRRRGEVDRAIRIHQNLIARTTLSAQQRALAVVELAQDYRRSGLLDRAETLFIELTQSLDYQIYAYRQLLDVYQQEHEWEKAIQTASELSKASGENVKSLIAHYYCEIAETARHQGLRDQAIQAIQKALVTDNHSVRASLLEGKLALDTGDKKAAIKAFRRIERQDATYLSEVIAPLKQCYQDINREGEFKKFLQYVLERYGGITPMLVLANMLQDETSEQQAADFIVKQLHKRPSIRGLDHLLDLALSRSGNITYEHLLLLKDITKQLLKNKPVYKCHHCGFTGKTLHWQCPSCKQWNTIKPIQGIEGE